MGEYLFWACVDGCGCDAVSVITQDIKAVAAALKRGECVAIPTETVYGLAALASRADAIAKVFALKQRPLTHSLIVHVAASFDISTLTSVIPEYAKQLMDAFWPGPLTLVLPRRPGCVLDSVTGGQDTVALRSPAHPLAQAILEAVGEPLVAPSANPFGKVSPTTAQHVQDSFEDADLLILDGGRCEVGIESTIVSATDPHGYHILRPGLIDEVLLSQVLAQPVSQPSAFLPRVSGQLKDHYQPEKPLRCFETHEALMQAYQQTSNKPYVLSFSTAFKPGFLLQNTPAKVAYELYYQLRLADALEIQEIWVELPPQTPVWQGVRDRLLKASKKY